MSQHDYVIANGTGAAVRSDLNNALAAIVSQNSGATAPATTYTYQWWADTTTGLLKLRNAANNAWITIGSLSAAGFGLLAAGDTLTAALGSASTPGITFTGDLNTGIYSPGADQIAISTGGTGRLFVSSAGLVGIGTSSPGTYLSIAATATDPTGLEGSAAFSINSNQTPKFQFGVGTSTIGYSAWIQNSVGNTNYSLSLQPRGGNVGVGTTSPGTPLEVQGSGSSGVQDNLTLYYPAAFGGDSSGPRMLLAGNNVSGTKVNYSAIWGLIATNTAGSHSGHLVFGTTTGGALTEKARIDSSGRLLVGTTTANTSGAKLQTVDGITFPATQVASADPNTLDDYEEGTWTPAIAGTTLAGAGTYSVQVGRYTKIGNTVTAHFNLTWSAHTGTGNMLISGLPFTSANVTNLNPAAVAYANNLTITGISVILVTANATTGTINSVNNGTAAALAIDTAATLIATITYQTA